MGLKQPLDSDTPVTGTKGRLGTKDLDRDRWLVWLKLRVRAYVGPEFELGRWSFFPYHPILSELWITQLSEQIIKLLHSNIYYINSPL